LGVEEEKKKVETFQTLANWKATTRQQQKLLFVCVQNQFSAFISCFGTILFSAPFGQLACCWLLCKTSKIKSTPEYQVA
jgi:hypothetical protein